jgi:PAS domain S-box-containing protein
MENREKKLTKTDNNNLIVSADLKHEIFSLISEDMSSHDKIWNIMELICVLFKNEFSFETDNICFFIKLKNDKLSPYFSLGNKENKTPFTAFSLKDLSIPEKHDLNNDSLIISDENDKITEFAGFKNKPAFLYLIPVSNGELCAFAAIESNLRKPEIANKGTSFFKSFFSVFFCAKQILTSENEKDKLLSFEKEIEYYHNVANATSSYIGMENVLSLVIEEILKRYPFDGYTIALINKENKLKAYLYRVPSASPDFLEKYVTRELEVSDTRLGLVSKVIKEDATYYIEDAKKIKIKTAINRRVVEELDIRTNLVLPIKYVDTVIGVLVLSTYNQNVVSLSKRDIETLERFTKQMSAAIKNSLLYEELNEERKKIENAFLELNQIYEISKIVNSSINLNEVLDLIIDEFLKILLTKYSRIGMAIYLADDDKSSLHLFKIYGGVPEQYLQIAKNTAIPILSDTGLLPKSFMKDKPIYIKNATLENQDIGPLDRTVIDFFRIRSLFYIPLKAGLDKIGVLVMTSHDDEALCFSDRDVEIINKICIQISTAVRNSYLYSNLEKQKDLFEKFFYSSPISILIFDTAGKILKANSSTQKLLGCKEKELINKNIKDFSSFRTHIFETNFKDAMEGKIKYIEEMPLEIDDKKLDFIVNMSIVPLKHAAGIDSFLCSIIDNTEKALAELELMEDLKMAKRLQEKILSQKIGRLSNFNIFSYYQPLEKVGGDFFEITELGEEHLRVFIADATGHGVQAALTTMLIKNEYDRFKSLSLEPATILSNLNDVFAIEYRHLYVFFSAVIVEINLKDMVLKISSAGHPSQLLIKKDNVEKIETKGTLIGIDKKSKFDNIYYGIEKGSKIILFTDGISEEFNIRGEHVALDTIKSKLTKHQNKNIAKMCNDLIKEFKNSVNAEGFKDDVTVIGIKIK